MNKIVINLIWIYSANWNAFYLRALATHTHTHIHCPYRSGWSIRTMQFVYYLCHYITHSIRTHMFVIGKFLLGMSWCAFPSERARELTRSLWVNAREQARTHVLSPIHAAQHTTTTNDEVLVGSLTREIALLLSFCCAILSFSQSESLEACALVHSRRICSSANQLWMTQPFGCISIVSLFQPNYLLALNRTVNSRPTMTKGGKTAWNNSSNSFCELEHMFRTSEIIIDQVCASAKNTETRNRVGVCTYLLFVCIFCFSFLVVHVFRVRSSWFVYNYVANYFQLRILDRQESCAVCQVNGLYLNEWHTGGYWEIASREFLP